MVIDVGKIPEGERIWDFVLSLDSRLVKNFMLNENIPVTLKTERRRSKISCFAKYKTEVTCECSRCLEEFKYEIENEVRFFVIHESETCNYDDEFDFYYYKSGNEKIYFAHTIYDDIVTKIPMKPLCKDNCEGITRFVRKNENEKNEQWNVLKKLIK
ncbi:MAG: DUF177 domain-containing protein [Chitinispirillales bacterium]|jgi:uncharacterized protein|nr:DUF177 domain-containing protein [Chitinispirillales bacterium]